MLIKVIIVFLSFSSLVHANDKFVLPKILSNGEVIMGKNADDAIKAKVNDFKLYNRSHFSKTSLEFASEQPMAIVGDFNADGYRDIFFMGYSKKNNKSYIMAAVSDFKSKKYKIFEIRNSVLENENFENNPVYLNLGKKGSLPILTRDIAQIEYYKTDVASAHGYYYSLKTKSFEVARGELD